MLDRTNDCWGTLDHANLAEVSWLNNGINNCLEGKQDHLISKNNLEFWNELRMGEVREQLIYEIESSVPWFEDNLFTDIITRCVCVCVQK